MGRSKSIELSESFERRIPIAKRLISLEFGGMGVGEFFDRTAVGYDNKYNAANNRFLAHFFGERMEAAIDGLDLAGKRIWDIGAGTGQLYRKIKRLAPAPDYHAVDISRVMLGQSDIPLDRRHVGTLADIADDIKEGSVDLFFMLGVTTYMRDNEIAESLRIMAGKMAPGGCAVITITNRASIEFLLQKTASRILTLPLVSALAGSTRRVAGGGFERNFMTLDHFETLLPPEATIMSTTWLNQTFTPFNRLLTGLSLATERGIRATTGNQSLLRRIASSDILVRVAFANH